MAKKKTTNTTPVGDLKLTKINSGKVKPEAEEDGPQDWFLEQIECTYHSLELKTKTQAARPKGSVFRSRMIAESGEETLHVTGQRYWCDILAEYKARKAEAVPESVVAPGAPSIPGARNWMPLGPTVVRDGQTVGGEPVGGRVARIAVSSDGSTVFAATAAGGVFRSDNAGTSWQSLMDGFDVDPTNFASTSLACGAIAIDPEDPKRIYVGTGEGDTHTMFASRIVNALPAYRGIGPIQSDDGGNTWHVESVATGDPDLAGEAFFELAVDPTDRENVVAATTAGLYRRVKSSGIKWHRQRSGLHSSVVVARSGATTRFFAAEWGKGVFHSKNGDKWTATGTGFPTGDIARIAVAVRPTDPSTVYAMVINGSGALRGVYRLDGVTGEWKKIASPPDVLPTNNGRSQGNYDLAIAIDPNDESLVYLGGSLFNQSPFPGSVWRCRVSETGSGNLKFDQKESIGTHAHADIHALVHSPGDSNTLWCGCDGGVFLNRNPRGSGEFAGMNEGLSCLCANFIAQHPTDPGILFTGLQDNGTARTGGSPSWVHVNWGDGGYCVINWADPKRVLTFANGRVSRSISGGTSHAGWTQVWNVTWATMTQPIVTTPFNPGSPDDAKWVAIGAGTKVFISKTFASSWPMEFVLPGGNAAGQVFALAFANTSLLYIGTTLGQIFRADRTGNTWNVERLDDAPAGPLEVTGLITDVAIDWSDSTNNSIYVSFGGVGDARHVWRFDGTEWEPRSGKSSATNLLDVEHNALIVDPTDPKNLYVGADIGVWHSEDAGVTWAPLQNGLPDAPVFDLQIHPTRRLLRAATHGRGLYELSLP